MRHLGSIVLAIVFAALSYVLAGYGQVKFVQGTASGTTDWSYVGLGVAALVVAGALYAVLVMTRISPLGPFLAGALLVAAELWYALDASSLVKLLGTSVLNVHGAQEAPLSGLALFAAVPLVLTIVSPRRWHGTEKVAVATESAAPTYATPDSSAPIYAPSQTTPDAARDAAVDAAAGGAGDAAADAANDAGAQAAGDAGAQAAQEAREGETAGDATAGGDKRE